MDSLGQVTLGSFSPALIEEVPSAADLDGPPEGGCPRFDKSLFPGNGVGGAVRGQTHRSDRLRPGDALSMKWPDEIHSGFFFFFLFQAPL